MALTLEDGSGVSGADSFATVAEFDAFALDYFGEDLAGTDAAKEAALRRAFVFMSGLIWRRGFWPTFGTPTPAAVKNGQMVFARAEISAPGAMSPTIDLSQSKVLTKVGSLGWTPTGGDVTVEGSRPVVTMGYDFLRPWLALDPARDGNNDAAWIMTI